MRLLTNSMPQEKILHLIANSKYYFTCFTAVFKIWCCHKVLGSFLFSSAITSTFYDH